MKIGRLKKILLVVFFFLTPIMNGILYANEIVDNSPISRSHLNMIKTLFLENKLQKASIKIDQYGRIELVGEYKDKNDVELAFSLAQSVAGVKRVSPVTPENIKIKEWARKISTFFPVQKKEITKPTSLLPPEIISKKYALLVGISKFNNDKINLKYADKDAQEFYSYLINLPSGNFKKENVYLLLNDKATNKNIHNILNSIQNLAGYNDEVIIYISSHGKPIYDGSMNIITYDTDTSSLPRAGLSSFWSEDLKDFILKTKAKNIVVILDVCYSGSAFKNITGFYNAKANVDVENDNQGVSRAVLAKSLLGVKDVVFEDDVLKTFDSPNKNSTVVLISASDQGQKSYESDVLKSGIFTKYFLDGLKQNSDVKRAFEYAKPNVIKRVKEEKKAVQNPQVVTDKKQWEIVL